MLCHARSSVVKISILVADLLNKVYIVSSTDWLRIAYYYYKYTIVTVWLPLMAVYYILCNVWVCVCVRYFWGGIMLGFPMHSFGAAIRYVALALLAREFYMELM
mgnify:CR=1 FL=1